MKAINIALDGPAAAGKSTIAETCSQRTINDLCRYRSNVSCINIQIFKIKQN